MPTPNPLQRIAAIGQLNEDGLPHWAAGRGRVAEDAGRAMVRLFDDMTKLDADAEEVRRDQALTELGKRNRLAQLGRNFVAVEIRTAREHRDRLAAEVARARAGITLPPVAGDPVIAELRAQEIRRSLAGGDKIAIEAAVMDAAARRDLATVRAIVDAPIPMLSPETSARATHAYLEALDPGIFGIVERLEQGLQQFERLIGNAQRRAAALGADPGRVVDQPPASSTDPSKTIEELAAG